MVTKNKALWIAATDVMEIVDRLGAALTPELREEHKFAIEVARAIEKGFLTGNGTPAIIRTLGAAYTELSVAHWEHCEELRKANDALKARQAAAAPAEPLDEVLAGRAPRYRGGDIVLARRENWDTALRGVVQSAKWRAEGIDNWVYTVQFQTEDGRSGGTFPIEEDADSWDIDFAK